MYERTATTPSEALLIVAICFGWAILGSLRAVWSGDLGADFSDAGFIGLIVTEILCAALALFVLQQRAYHIAALYPVPTLGGLGVALLLYLASTLTGALLQAPFAADQGAQPLAQSVADAAFSTPVLVTLGIVNGMYEEVFLLGFLQRGLRAWGRGIAIGLPLLLRVSYHLYQGTLGALSILGFGLVLGLYYARSERLFPVVLAHALADIAPFL
jgi:uncharacterized protein